jgi:hypothetical protein
MAHLAARDPDAARAGRPTVVGAARELRHYPLVSVLCPEGHWLAFCGVAGLSTMALVIPAKRRRTPQERTGGLDDLVVGDDPDAGFALLPALQEVRTNFGAVSSSYAPKPLFDGIPGSGEWFDGFRRLTFSCKRCRPPRAQEVKNTTLLGWFFEAASRGHDELRLTDSAPRYSGRGSVRRRPDPGMPREA